MQNRLTNHSEFSNLTRVPYVEAYSHDNNHMLFLHNQSNMARSVEKMKGLLGNRITGTETFGRSPMTFVFYLKKPPDERLWRSIWKAFRLQSSYRTSTGMRAEGFKDGSVKRVLNFGSPGGAGGPGGRGGSSGRTRRSPRRQSPFKKGCRR
jgi:hypothetical protein